MILKTLSEFQMNQFDSFDAMLALIKRMEATVLGLHQLRSYVGDGAGQEIVAELIKEAESNLEEVKRRIVQ